MSDLTNPSSPNNGDDVTRRQFVKATGMSVAAASITAPMFGARLGGRQDTVTIGVIGCGGRGTGAAANAIEASADTKIVAMADVFPDRLASSRGNVETLGDRGTIKDSRAYTGFNAYQELLDHGDDIDYVILATPPHFRPMHFEASIKAGKHVFMEKPVAVDPAGIRKVIAASKKADEKGLSVATGTQRRHEACYLAAMQRIHDGALGELMYARCFWNQGGLWVKDRQPEWSDMEWQMRNWLYFTWLSGDHICEQHIHNLDACNWAFGGPPARCTGLGGRQVRTDPKYGHIFDHFAIEFEYPGGQYMMSMCRQQDGCADTNRVEEVIVGTKGHSITRSGHASLHGENAWRYEGENRNPYVQEHADLIASMRSGPRLNEAKRTAESTLTAIMGRMAAYTGQPVTFEQALNSKLDLSPDTYAFGDMPVPPVPMPGQTKLI